jgi:ribosomal protein S12 methylthiotransferase
LGCPKNLVDTEKIMGSMVQNGISVCDELEDCDAVVINTCGFIKPALKETEAEIQKILKHNKKIFVYGCAVNRAYKELAKKFPEINHWYPISEKNKLLEDILNKRKIKRGARLLTTYGYAYLKIADGCSNHCAYCTIPYIKGEFRSHKFEDLVEESRGLAELGIKEIILIAQDTANYGFDLYGKKMLVPLIREISKIKNIEWIRLLYVHPRSLDENLIAEIKGNPKVCKYLEIPIQHINDRILKLMNRGIMKKEIIQKIKELKGITLRTTVIAGFPTETEEEFKELYDFLGSGYFDWFGVFKYYREEETPAAQLECLPRTVVERRFKMIVELQQRLIKERNKLRINKFYKILIHKKNRDFIGHAEFSAPEIDGKVIVKRNDVEIGKFCRLKIAKFEGVDLYAY